jgi:hypothetical protein
MRGPKPLMIDLADAERQELERLVRRYSTPQQLALRAQIVLAAADGANNCQIARQLDVSLSRSKLMPKTHGQASTIKRLAPTLLDC